MMEYFGFGSIKHLKTALDRCGARKIFVVTGKRSYELSGAKRCVGPILAGYRQYYFSDFPENITLKDLLKGLAGFKREKCDVVMAIGGGSVIDMAKLIGILSVHNGTPLSYITKINPLKNPGKPLIAVPTTAGSGSEATHFAVIYVDGVKYSVAHRFMLPVAAIVDPQFTVSLPPRITANTGMDAFCHGIESYWSINSTSESKEYSREAIMLVRDHLAGAVNAPTLKNREQMAKAAFLAGKAINITETTAPHALSYALTANFDIPHGHAVSLTLPDFLVYNYGVNKLEIADRRGVGHVKNTIRQIADLLGCRGPFQAAQKILELMETIGLATSLAQMGINEKTAFQLAMDNVNVERLKNNPRRVGRERLKEVLVE